MDKALEQFLTAAKQIADVAHFDSVQVGSIVTDSQPSTVIAMSARLIRTDTAPERLQTLQLTGLKAQQHRISLLNLRQLMEKLGPAWSAQSSPQGTWQYISNDHDAQFRHCSTASLRGPRITEILPLEASTDALIAEESDYAYASLSRLIKAFTGLKIAPQDSSQRTRIELVAPWPIQSLEVSFQGGLPRVTAMGLNEIDPSRFILNIEGAQKDKRLDASSLRWQTVSTADPDQVEYTASFDARDISPLAVNLFVRDAPVLLLRTEFSPPPFPSVSSSAGTLFKKLPEALFAPSVLADASFAAMAPAAVQQTAALEGTRLTRLHVSGLRLLHSVELELAHPFAVIVGPNQSGKSSLLEALQLMADAAKGELSEALVRRRGGLSSVMTRGGLKQSITFEADLEHPHAPALRYRLMVSPVGTYDFTVTEETLSQQVNGQWAPLLTRRGSAATLAGVSLALPNERESMVSQLGLAHPVVEAVRASLSAIAIYPYFRTGAAWADPESTSMRRPVRLEPGARLDRSGDNLAAALFSLRDERPADWEEYLGITRLAFPNLKDLRMPAVSRGTVQLFWDDTSGQSFDASELSDGTLSFLSILCALFQPGSALIAVDEPEQHLHPDALRRLVGAARSLSDRQPILFTTQSDVLVGFLDEVPESVVVASRGPEGATLVRPDLTQLQEWLKTFSLREMRRELEGWSQEP